MGRSAPRSYFPQVRRRLPAIDLDASRTASSRFWFGSEHQTCRLWLSAGYHHTACHRPIVEHRIESNADPQDGFDRRGHIHLNFFRLVGAEGDTGLPALFGAHADRVIASSRDRRYYKCISAEIAHLPPYVSSWIS